MCAGHAVCGLNTDARVGFLRSQGLFHSASEKMYQFVPVHPPPTPASLMMEPNWVNIRPKSIASGAKRADEPITMTAVEEYNIRGGGGEGTGHLGMPPKYHSLLLSTKSLALFSLDEWSHNTLRGAGLRTSSWQC